MVKVKICANKSIEDAQMCIKAGADIIGILVGQEHTSNDFVNKEMAKHITEYVAGRCDVALVTHLTQADEIIKLTEYIGNNIIQLHSEIDESEVEKIVTKLPNVKLIRLIHLAFDGTIYTDYTNMKYVDYYLLDSFNLKTGQVGGTGLTHDWNKSNELIKKLDKPTFLAGGLTPDNVKEAVRIAQPYGVDVNSGCKDKFGKKDAEKVRLFVTNAKGNKKIIFDLDNTLLFISPEWKNRYQKFIDRYQLNITPMELYSCIGTFGENNHDIVVTYKIMCDYLNNKLSIEFTEHMFIELLDIYKKIPLLYTDTIFNVLQYLSHKYELIIYTNWFSKNQLDRLKSYNLDQFFSKIYGWDDIEIKPSKVGLKKILENNNIDEYIFIGDDINIDLVVPDSMGMNTIFFNRKSVKQSKFREIFNIEELKEIL